MSLRHTPDIGTGGDELKVQLSPLSLPLLNTSATTTIATTTDNTSNPMIFTTVQTQQLLTTINYSNTAFITVTSTGGVRKRITVDMEVLT